MSVSEDCVRFGVVPQASSEPTTERHVMRTPSAQTLDDLGVKEIFEELEEVRMTIVGGLDVHRQQITFDYVDNDGPCAHCGRMPPARR